MCVHVFVKICVCGVCFRVRENVCVCVFIWFSLSLCVHDKMCVCVFVKMCLYVCACVCKNMCMWCVFSCT